MLALLDFDEFHDLLLDATRELLLHLHEEYRGKRIYAFYLFHDPLWGFIVPSLSVQGGILKPKPLQQYTKMLTNYTLKSSDMPSLLAILPNTTGKFGDTKWVQKQPTDPSIRRSIGREYFEAVNMWLLRAQFHRVTFTHKQIEQYHRTMTVVCIDVLKALDKRGLFGEGEKRQQTMINLVMMKDPKREWLQHAKDLNPPDVYHKWIEALEEYNILN